MFIEFSIYALERRLAAVKSYHMLHATKLFHHYRWNVNYNMKTTSKVVKAFMLLLCGQKLTLSFVHQAISELDIMRLPSISKFIRKLAFDTFIEIRNSLNLCYNFQKLSNLSHFHSRWMNYIDSKHVRNMIIEFIDFSTVEGNVSENLFTQMKNDSLEIQRENKCKHKEFRWKSLVL